jgi:hypothetical protein
MDTYTKSQRWTQRALFCLMAPLFIFAWPLALVIVGLLVILSLVAVTEWAFNKRAPYFPSLPLIEVATFIKRIWF